MNHSNPGVAWSQQEVSFFLRKSMGPLKKRHELQLYWVDFHEANMVQTGVTHPYIGNWFTKRLTIPALRQMTITIHNHPYPIYHALTMAYVGFWSSRKWFCWHVPWCYLVFPSRRSFRQVIGVIRSRFTASLELNMALIGVHVRKGHNNSAEISEIRTLKDKIYWISLVFQFHYEACILATCAVVA